MVSVEFGAGKNIGNYVSLLSPIFFLVMDKEDRVSSADLMIRSPKGCKK